VNSQGFEFSLDTVRSELMPVFNLQANFCLYKPLPFATAKFFTVSESSSVFHAQGCLNGPGDFAVFPTNLCPYIAFWLTWFDLVWS
jgi:hypothetical protein